MAPRLKFQTIFEWHQLIGVDETIASKPVNRTAESKPKPTTHTGTNAKASPSTEDSLASSERLFPNSPPMATTITQNSNDTVKTAVELAALARSIEELRKALETFDGCPLKKTATNLVFVDGNVDADVLFIGEGPGAEEDRQGVPFVGKSGNLLDKMLASIGLSREEILISNTVFWRPPGNRTPTPQEIAACMPFVERLIEIVKPKILVMLGGAAAKSLLGEVEGIGRLRGRWFSFKTQSMLQPVLATPIFHPAYLLRTPIQKRTAWHDLRLIQKKLAELQ